MFDTVESGDGYSAHVDVYNASSNTWTSYPAGLGKARAFLAAASLPSGIVLFAGGYLSGVSCRFFNLKKTAFTSVTFSSCIHVSKTFVFALFTFSIVLV
jgi:hypothetical protein